MAELRWLWMEFILPIPLTHQMSLLSFGHNHLTFLAEALPLRSVGTFIELLIGAMLTPASSV